MSAAHPAQSLIRYVQTYKVQLLYSNDQCHIETLYCDVLNVITVSVASSDITLFKVSFSLQVVILEFTWLSAVITYVTENSAQPWVVIRVNLKLRFP